jgi:hypothetical protein
MVHFKIPFWSICTIIPSLTCFPMKFFKPIITKFYHVWALGWVLGLIIRLIFPTFQLFSPIFSTSLWMWLGLAHPSIASLPQWVCTHPIDSMGIHLLCCAHDSECMGTHDAIHNIFVAIVRDVGLYVGQEQLHAHFFQQCSPPLFDESTLCSLKMEFAP